MEALAVGLPMVFYGTIPGQERLNAAWVVQQGAGINATDLDEATMTVLRPLDHPAQLEAMRVQARSLGRPRAAEDLVERLIIPHGKS
jgi:processive 1,2-diacylglycerol beta-glucosyltransferase